MKITDLKDKKILILGLGKEGIDTFNFLRKAFPKKNLGLADVDRTKKNIFKNKKNINLYLGKNYLKALKQGKYNLIIKSPGIKPDIISPYINKKQIITSQTEIFFDNCPGKIIGLTGTKGKGTTALLIYRILIKDGKKAHLIGNIGRPVLHFLASAKKDHLYIFELSSHQLYNLKKSPQIAVFLNIFPDHLDYYQNFKQYLRAKTNILLHQNNKDYLIYNANDKFVRQASKKSKAKKITIKGDYYNLNIKAAKAVAKIFNIKTKTVEETIKQFKNLDHRLEKVGIFKKITFYNDSAATIPQATIGAIKVIGPKLETIILGGWEKNLDYKELARKVLKSRIKNVILFPPTGKKIMNMIVRQNKNKKEINFFPIKKNKAEACMEKTVKTAYKHTGTDKICLLSPASASFGIFKDYKQRGDLFKKYVKKYGTEKTTCQPAGL